MLFLCFFKNIPTFVPEIILFPRIMAISLIITGIILFILGMGRKRSNREPDIPFENPEKMKVGDKEYWV